MPMIVKCPTSPRTARETFKMITAYRDRLLELCGDEQMARKLHDDHYRRHQQLGSEWDKYTKISEIEAMESIQLSPTEKKYVVFTVDWKPDGLDT